MRRAGLAVLALALAAGCDRSPRAPALRDEPVYSNSRDGLSFVSPPGWVQSAKSDPPDEQSEKDRLLVSYRTSPGASQAWFEVWRADLPEDADLAARLALASHASGSAWQPSGQPEQSTVGSAPATRFTFTNQDRLKESTTVRRRTHVYFFTVISAKSDEETRRRLRQIISEARWTK